jgi:taurine dioxygenase
MAIRHTPITPALGALVEGADLARITPVEFCHLYEIWKKHHVLVLRDQRLTPQAFEEFAWLLGEKDAGDPLALPSADEACWHTDLPCRERPPFAAMLWAIDIPRAGGDLWFASMPAALRSMPADLVARLRRMAIRHEDPTLSTGTLHPVVVVQPETGEETLYPGRRRNACIAGLPQAESERLLNILWSYATAQDVTLRHQWRAGDVVLWNNLTTIHRRDAFPANDYRALRHAQIKGRYVLSAPIQKEAA